MCSIPDNNPSLWGCLQWRGPPCNAVGWLPGEDALLALGLLRFGKDPGKLNRYFLPGRAAHRAANEIPARIRALLMSRAGDNPVKVRVPQHSQCCFAKSSNAGLIKPSVSVQKTYTDTRESGLLPYLHAQPGFCSIRGLQGVLTSSKKEAFGS